MSFSKGRFRNYNFILNNETLEIVKEFKYLGILFSRSGSFLAAKKHIAAQATRAISPFDEIPKNVVSLHPSRYQDCYIPSCR